MTWSRPRTLLWRMGLALMGAQVLIAIALGAYAFLHVRRFHYDQTLGELRRLMPILTARLDEEMRTADSRRVDDMVKEDGRRTGIRITIILSDGRVIADSETDPANMENHRYGRPEIEAALTAGDGSAVRFSSTLAESMMYFARRVEADGESVIVRTALPLTKIDEELSRITRVVAAAGLCSLLATFIVIYLVSRRFTRQVRGLAAGAARFTQGRLEHRIAQPAAAELSALAQSLNDMARQFDDRLQQLQTRDNEQRAILQSMSNGVIALDAEQRIIIMNRAAEQILSLKADQAKGRLLQEVIREPELNAFVSAARAGDRSPPRELHLGGERSIVVQATAESLQRADSEEDGLLIILNEITRLRRLEAVRSDFAANVSHELRTPITNIKGYVETLLDIGWEDRDQAERFLSIIKANSSRLAAIVEDVLALAKLEQPLARDAMERQSFAVADVLRTIAGQFEAAAAEREISVVIEAPPELPVLAHRPLLEQALANLLSNAVRYASPGTTVTLRAESSEGRVILSVEDEGPGIAAVHLPRLFERFYRVDKARSRELGGTGLGLAIVKHIALMHGGVAEVESAPGRGSTFRIVLPQDPDG